MLKKLSACPFCGGEAYLEDLIMGVWVKCMGHRDRTNYHVKCTVIYGPFDSKHEATIFWNKRHEVKPPGRPRPEIQRIKL